MGLTHTRCFRTGRYSIHVAGVIGRRGVLDYPVTVTVLQDGSWYTQDGRSADATALDFRDSVVAPALYDAHVHMYAGCPVSEFLRYGVCRVRDLGSPVSALPAHRAYTCDGSPELVMGGPMVDRPGSPRLPSAVAWQGPEDLCHAIDDAERRGASWMKVYAGFPLEFLALFVERVHAKGMRVAAHPYPRDTATVVQARVDEIEHIASLSTYRAGTLGNAQSDVCRAWARPVSDNELERMAELLADTVLCPTVVVHKRIVDIMAHRQFPSEAPARLIREWSGLRSVSAQWAPSLQADAQLAYQYMAECSVALYRHGVGIAIGSDTPNPGVLPGRGLWEELNLLIKGGMAPIETYLLASVEPGGIRQRGVFDLTLIPATWIDDVRVTHKWPCAPVTGVVRRGCLYREDGVVNINRLPSGASRHHLAFDYQPDGGEAA